MTRSGDGRSLAAVDEFASYDGSSWFLRWWPKILLGLALWVLVIGWSHSIQWATFFVLCAWAHGRLLPWRFVVFDEGLLLVFPSLIEGIAEAIVGRDIDYTATFGLIVGAAVLLKQRMQPAPPKAPAASG